MTSSSHSDDIIITATATLVFPFIAGTFRSYVVFNFWNFCAAADAPPAFAAEQQQPGAGGGRALQPDAWHSAAGAETSLIYTYIHNKYLY